MLKNSILSWKIDSCTYAYIFPINNSYVSNRIPEDSPLWSSIIDEIGKWDYDTYYSNFQKMSKEVSEKYGTIIPWDELYWNFADENNVGNVNIVLLAGKDGEGYVNGGNGTSSGDEVYEEFKDAINKELDKAKQDIEEQNKKVEEFVEKKVEETITEAKNTIAETKKELADTREELENKLEGAAEALDKAAALFDMGEAGITGEKIKEALSSVTECGKWITANSGTVHDFKTDYDAAKRILGGIGSAEDALAGLFSQIGTTINDMDNTVGNVESWMVASAATIGDIATWYDVNASAVTEASSIINASAGTITDAINFISGDGLTTKVTSIMDGRNAVIKDEIMAETSAAVTNVRNVLNGLSGVVETSIARLDGIDGDLTSLGSRMSAEEQKMEQWMTVSDSAMTVAQDLRETWSVESGKLSTVASLTAQVDDEGNVMYFVSGSTDSESDDIRVWKDDNDIWRDSNGVAYDEEDVIVHWSQAMASYIQQQTSAITMSVMGEDNLTAAIKLAISGDSSIISMVAEEVVIDANVIARAISAETANIGGILIGDGRIECMKTNNGRPLFSLNGHDGSLYAQNAYIEGTVRATSGQFNGSITATSLTLGPNYGDKSITEYIDDKVPSDVTSSGDVQNMISDYVSTPEFKNSITKGYITEEDLQKWAESQSNLTEDDVKKLIDTWGNTKVNTTFTSTTEDGQTRYVLSIGGEQYEWYTYELKDQDGNGFVALNRPYTGDTESGVTSVLVSTNGLLQAHNAIIHGCIHAIAGEIGGLKLNDSRLMVSRNGNYNDSIAYLNGSNTYADSERGTIILAAGISSGRTYHKYTCSQDTKYSTIYTKKKYLISNGDESGCEVEAYEYNEEIQTYIRLENQFYFLTTKVTEPSSEDDVPIKDSDGKSVFIKQYIVRKYYNDNVIEEIVEYSYEGTVSSEEKTANTRIFEDGTIISNTLVANDGYFGGEINATGRFRGTLENVGGTLKGVTIDANLINGNIVIGNSDSIKAKSGDQLYFNIDKEPLSDNAAKEYWNIDAFSWERQNSNGTNAGQYYTDKITIAYVPFKSGATITIPALNGSIYRYAAAGKTNKTSYLWVEANVRYFGNPTEKNLIREKLTAASHGHKTSPTVLIKTPKSIFTAEADGVLSITFEYSVHLSTYSWLNADKSYAKINFNKGGSKITVEYPEPTKGVSIAPNGMRVLTVSGASVSILGNTITLLSPSKYFGLRITDSGVQIRKGSLSEDSWTNL